MTALLSHVSGQRCIGRFCKKSVLDLQTEAFLEQPLPENGLVVQV